MKLATAKTALQKRRGSFAKKVNSKKTVLIASWRVPASYASSKLNWPLWGMEEIVDKMKCESPDLTQANIARLAEIFPSVVTEARGEDGRLKKAVNFEALRQLMSSEVLDGDEAYEFTWVGKKAAIVERVSIR